uniref:DB domain-containing protein n=1 Tax=Elaeophora elaphi TaxID=1147741 RepID=A0A0R3RZI1_9BILA
MSRIGLISIVLTIFIADRPATSLIRRCTCEEDDECWEEALASVDQCSSDCGYNLAPIGGEIQDMVDCFGKQGPAIQAEDVCLRRKVDYKCDDRSQSTFINETNFDNLELTFNETTRPTAGPLIKRIYDSLNAIFKYNYCIRMCYKNVTIECYKGKGCAPGLADRETLMSFVKECVGAYSLFYIEQIQACHCLLHKLHLTKLTGACIHIGNPFLKEIHS